MGKILSAVVALILFGVVFTSLFGSSLERDAKRALKAQGLTAEQTRMVTGLREDAVCGRTKNYRFIYRERKDLILEGNYTPTQFEALYEGWCG